MRRQLPVLHGARARWDAGLDTADTSSVLGSRRRRGRVGHPCLQRRQTERLIEAPPRPDLRGCRGWVRNRRSTGWRLHARYARPVRELSNSAARSGRGPGQRSPGACAAAAGRVLRRRGRPHGAERQLTTLLCALRLVIVPRIEPRVLRVGRWWRARQVSTAPVDPPALSSGHLRVSGRLHRHQCIVLVDFTHRSRARVPTTVRVHRHNAGTASAAHHVVRLDDTGVRRQVGRHASRVSRCLGGEGRRRRDKRR